MIEKIREYAAKHGDKNNYLFSVQELSRSQLLRPVKATSYWKILQSVRNGEIKAQTQHKFGKNFYFIPVQEVIKYYQKKEQEQIKSPLPLWQRNYIKKLPTAKAVKYLYERGYTQAVIAKELRVSRQRVNQLIKNNVVIKNS